MTAARPASAQEPRRQRTRAALLAAGAELLANRPIDAIPVNDIVDAAGVAKGSFFNHFADKDAFAAEIAAGIRDQVERQVTEANAGVSDPALRVAGGVSRFVVFALNDARSARIMLRGHVRGWAADHPLNAGLRADIRAGAAAGRFRVDDELAAVVYVVGLCQMLLGVVSERPLDGAQAGKLTTDVLILLLTGLGVDRADAGVIAASAAGAAFA